MKGEGAVTVLDFSSVRSKVEDGLNDLCSSLCVGFGGDSLEISIVTSLCEKNNHDAHPFNERLLAYLVQDRRGDMIIHDHGSCSNHWILLN